MPVWLSKGPAPSASTVNTAAAPEASGESRPSVIATTPAPTFWAWWTASTTHRS
jgi:hypothetical protein